MNDNLNITFSGKKEHEAVAVFTRRHWVILVKPIIGSIGISILPLFLIIIGGPIILKYHASGLVALIWVILEMCILFGLFYKLSLYSLDTWIVTNERILDIQQLGLFNRKVSELHLESIQDISVNTNGIIQSYFDFGNVEIQTAGTAQRFMFQDIPHPIMVKDKIMHVAREYENNLENNFGDKDSLAS